MVNVQVDWGGGGMNIVQRSLDHCDLLQNFVGVVLVKDGLDSVSIILKDKSEFVHNKNAG